MSTLGKTARFESLRLGIGGATFLLLPVWGAVLSLRPTQMAWATLVDVGATTIAFALIYLGTVRLGRVWQIVVGVLLAVVFCLVGYDSINYIYDSLRGELISYGILDQYKPVLRITIYFIGLAAALLVIFKRAQVIAGIKGFGHLLWILFSIFVLQFIYLKVVSDWYVKKNSSLSTITNPVIVLVFDELDSDTLEASLDKLPAFKALAARARIVGSVYPPSNYTHISLPAMLLGHPISGSAIAGDSIFFTQTNQIESKILVASDHLFEGIDSSLISLIGWHLPYCGLFKKIDRCIDDSSYGVPGENLTTIQWLYGKSSILFNYRNNNNLKIFGDIDAYTNHFFCDPRNFKFNNIARLLNELEQRLVTDVKSAKYALVFAHLPCPHLPRLDGAVTKGMMNDYVDNLRRCDKILESLSQVVNQKNKNPTRLLVTSDHWFRSLDWVRNGRPHAIPSAPRKVPFFYAEGDKQLAAVNISDGNNVVLAHLVRLLMREDIVDINKLLAEIKTYGPRDVKLDPF